MDNLPQPPARPGPPGLLRIDEVLAPLRFFLISPLQHSLRPTLRLALRFTLLIIFVII